MNIIHYMRSMNIHSSFLSTHMSPNTRNSTSKSKNTKSSNSRAMNMSKSKCLVTQNSMSKSTVKSKQRKGNWILSTSNCKKERSCREFDMCNQ